MGNLKFDLAPDEQLLARGRQWRRELDRPVVLAASTREGEETPLLQAWARLPAPRPLLLLVPRHPQRFDEIATLVTAAGFSLQRRSTWDEQPPDDAAIADVWLGDSLGEMSLYYATADVALLGGSFAPLGGQNLIEAAACGCPLLMGPHTFNFAQAAELSLAAGAAERLADIDAAVQRAAVLAHDAATKAMMAAAARDFAAQHSGAAQRMAQAVLALMPGLPSSLPDGR
jgi:3-deoxy-D-manno-octulosonic-acid transferase